ncbi:MAG: polyribonucleotide nucleotidyltransferase [Proteobacteria bacterium]|nr:polyribonucleotide nucleotidyltransferase [Pseudomonadota bacterium]
MNIHKVEIEIGGRTLSFETGKLAKQSNGSVVVRQDDSMVLMTACASTSDVPFDFLPLTVVYQDRTGGYGSIPGGYLKREGRPSERETLISRLIDRPIRPQFPKHFRREMQVIATVMSYDQSSDTDVLALCGAAAALHVSDIPMEAPVAGVRIVRLDGEFKINPSIEEQDRADINLVVAGSRDGICMVEGGADEAQEDAMIEAMDLAFAEIQKIIDAIEELRALAGKEKITVEPAPELNEDVLAQMIDLGAQDALVEALAIVGKHERKDGLKAARNGIIDAVLERIESKAAAEGLDEVAVEDVLSNARSDAKKAWDKQLSKTMRKTVAEKGIRIDGRSTDEIRDIWVEVGVAPRAHGSAVFTRGETQGFITASLGVLDEAQRIEQPNFKGEQRWMLQYNFPPFSTGEVRRMGGPKRREVGHGVLAHRAIEPVLPSAEEFPYVFRCSADILESNGSSSMATVCGASLSLMDAGVPISSPVAGIAMGLIKEDDQYVVLSDILGDEDHLGDMDFKVTGSAKGITAFQMDTKIGSIPRDVMFKAMNQAKEGRIHILGEMAKVISAPREELSDYAPRITTIQIKPDKIRDVIGKGGNVIRGMQDEFDVKISIEDSGAVSIAAKSQEVTDAVINRIRELTEEPEIGKMYLGTVKRIEDFGAFVEILPNVEGLVHISQLEQGRVDKVTDICQEGDEMLVKVIPPDRSGRLRLSRKEALDL